MPTPSKQIIQELEDHFANTPKEEIQAIWEKTKEWNNIGPTVDEFIKNHPMYNKETKLIGHRASEKIIENN